MKLTGFICTSGTCLYNTGFPIEWFLAHLSQSDRVSFCDRFSSGVRPSSVRP
jgi:hypothetical protein